jgi:hypothetical protein
MRWWRVLTDAVLTEDAVLILLVDFCGAWLVTQAVILRHQLNRSRKPRRQRPNRQDILTVSDRTRSDLDGWG